MRRYFTKKVWDIMIAEFYTYQINLIIILVYMSCNGNEQNKTKKENLKNFWIFIKIWMRN